MTCEQGLLRLLWGGAEVGVLRHCIQGTSEKVRRVLNEAGVKVALRPIRTIDQILPSPKDPHNPEEKSCVVYQVPCLTAISFTLDRLNGILNHV